MLMTLQNRIIVHRGEDCPVAWLAHGKQFRAGAFTVAILRGDHPDEPVMAEFGADRIEVEPLDNGAKVTLALTAEDIARAQGPARPVIESMIYRVCHDGAELLVAFFDIFPRSSEVEAQRCVGARKGVAA